MKVALVTGSAKGLGKAIIQHLAQQGYAVVIHYQNSEKEALALQKELLEKTKVLCIGADLTKNTEVENLFRTIENTFGRLDILVNNVGNYLKKNILELSFGEWNEMIQNNLNTVFYCSKLGIELMQKNNYGRIINIGFAGIGNTQAEPSITPYFIAKQGVLVLTKSLAQSLANQYINVNIVSPGVLENSISQPLEEIPIGRLASLQEFVNVVDFLISEKADYITGTHIEVAGGWRL